MAKTVAVALVMLCLSIAPLTVLAQSIPSNIGYAFPFPYHWIVFVIIAALSIIILLLAANSLKKPASFASLPVYQFFELTIFVIFFILSISFVPTPFFGSGSVPISTGTFTDPQNQTQWVLNIGGNLGDPNTSGLLIPIYVIIAGILGAYIRYLYIGISEFKESFQQKLNSFEESHDSFFRALDEYNAHTRQTIAPWPPNFPMIFVLLSPREYIDSKIKYAQRFEYEVTLLENDREDLDRNEVVLAESFSVQVPKPKKPEPTYEIPNPKFDNTKPESLENPRELTVSFKEKRRILWSNIRKAESDFKKHRFTIGLEITTHILKTVGSFFLGPLLAVLAWLLLSITGIDGSEINGVLTFALVSFAIGLTTKTIITRVMNFVGEKFGDESPPAAASTTTKITTTPAATTSVATRTDTSTTQTPSIVIDPKQARAGQLVSVKGDGFRANSRTTLEYVRNGDGANNTIQTFRETFQSSSEGEFGFRFWLSTSLPAGTYNVYVKDDDSKSASGEFIVS